jgi:ABC-type nitrate/sulfonate/bicarbonate transport system permease component
MLTFGALLLTWEGVAALQVVSPVFLPAPSAALAAMWQGFASGTLGLSLAATLERMLYGWLLASLLGVVLGCAIGISPQARALLQPTLEFFRPLPAPAIVPVAIAFLGLTPAMVVLVIAFGAMWPALVAAIQGVTSVEPRLYEVSRALGLGRRDVILKIALPNAVPDICAGARIGLAIALVLTVVGEFLAGQEGLGLEILQAARRFRADELFAGVMLLGAVGFTANALLGMAERRMLSWRRPMA